MRHGTITMWFGVSVLGLAMIGGESRGDFVFLDDFDDMLLGPVDDQGNWNAANDTSVVSLDPADPTNQVLAVTTDSTHLRRDMLLLNGTVRMMFLRFRIAEQQNFSFGMSGYALPSQFGDFETELGMSNSTNDLRINDDGSYDDLVTLEAHTWYNCWLLIDNLGETTQVYLHTRDGDRAYASDQLDSDGQTTFVFRSGSAGDLLTFFIKTGGGNGPSGPLYLDDMYLENTNALNLGNPTSDSCPGDLDGDGDTDQSDLGILLADYGCGT